MQHEEIIVSIFIPVYNGEEFLKKTLDSVLEQTYRNLEILCVDDSSTDGSLVILNEYAKCDSRVRVFSKPNGGSVPPSWEYIIPHIQGDFTLYMSQDDLLKTNTIELLVKKQHETCADAVIPHEIHFVEGIPIEKMHHLNGVNGDTTPVISGKDAFRLMIDYTISGRALWSTKIVRKIRMPADTFNADELAQRLWVAECKRVAFSDAVFLYCKNNPQAITKGLLPHTYDDTLTNALLYNTATKVFPVDTIWLQQLSGKYFHHLYLRMIQYIQQWHNYTKIERCCIKRRFQMTYRILHHDIHTDKRKFRLAAMSMPMMWCMVIYNYLKLKKKRIFLDQEMDCYSYTAI